MRDCNTNKKRKSNAPSLLFSSNTMRRSLLIGMLLILIITKRAYSQDPQFSQYYAAPLILNPALTGGSDCYRAGANVRTQWVGLQKPFSTASVFADLNYSDLRSGFGILAIYDKAGTPRLTTAELSGLYSYLAPFTEAFNIRFGIQGSYVSRRIDYTPLIFEDQYTGTTLTNNNSIDPVTGSGNTDYFDASAGILFFGEDSYWLGFSAHHLNQPDQGFYTSSKLPVKYSVHGGYNIYYKKGILQREEDWLQIVPTFLYKAQSRFDQLDLGIYFIQRSILLGLWYRGIFIKEDNSFKNSDALVVQAGIQLRNLSIGYSYDFTTSKLQFRNTLGSHEISLLYYFCLDWPRRKKPARRIRRLPCPDHQRSLKF